LYRIELQKNIACHTTIRCFVEFDQFIHLGEEHERLLKTFIHLGGKCQRLFQNVFTLAKKMRKFYKIYPAW
jgi:hypothetical protein